MDWLRKLTEDDGPVCWWGRMPVYASTLLVAIQTAAMALIALAVPLGYKQLPELLAFSTSDVLANYHIWQILTYILVATPSLWFLLEMAMLWFFGTEVEKAIGRRAFLQLYALLIFLPPFAFLIPAVFGSHSSLFGADSPNFCTFLAFAAIYPGAQMLFGITAKWFAIGLFALNSLQLIYLSSWNELSAFWLNVATVILFLQKLHVQGLSEYFSWLQSILPPQNPRQKPSNPTPIHPQKPSIQLPLKKDKPVQNNTLSDIEADPIASIDHILDKIARHGLNSLTPAERERLNRARQALLERERKR